MGFLNVPHLRHSRRSSLPVRASTLRVTRIQGRNGLGFAVFSTEGMRRADPRPRVQCCPGIQPDRIPSGCAAAGNTLSAKACSAAGRSSRARSVRVSVLGTGFLGLKGRTQLGGWWLGRKRRTSASLTPPRVAACSTRTVSPAAQQRLAPCGPSGSWASGDGHGVLDFPESLRVESGHARLNGADRSYHRSGRVLRRTGAPSICRHPARSDRRCSAWMGEAPRRRRLGPRRVQPGRTSTPSHEAAASSDVMLLAGCVSNIEELAGGGEAARGVGGRPAEGEVR